MFFCETFMTFMIESFNKDWVTMTSAGLFHIKTHTYGHNPSNLGKNVHDFAYNFAVGHTCDGTLCVSLFSKSLYSCCENSSLIILSYILKWTRYTENQVNTQEKCLFLLGVYHLCLLYTFFSFGFSSSSWLQWLQFTSIFSWLDLSSCFSSGPITNQR